MELRYSELKYEGQTYTEQWKIDEILIKNKFNWMVNAEIKNARLEIYEDTLVWNAGIWYNGDWYFGVWRDGEWRYGEWQNGVWYNGVWRNGTFKSGIIYRGNFFKGKIEGGEIRGGNFIDIDISSNVKEYSDDETEQAQAQAQQEIEGEVQHEVAPGDVKSVGSKPAAQQDLAQTQPQIQFEKNNYNKMNKLKNFKTFVKESVGELEDSYIDINIDETELETSDRPNLGKLKQKPGKEIIENPSKTDTYNAEMRKGGETIVDPKTGETIHNVGDTK